MYVNVTYKGKEFKLNVNPGMGKTLQSNCTKLIVPKGPMYDLGKRYYFRSGFQSRLMRIGRFFRERILRR